MRLRDKKKNSEQKKKIPFYDLRFFYLSRGEEKGKKEQYTHRVNSNLPVRVLPGERNSIAFYKQGKITPLLQKTIPEIEKQKEKHNT